MTPFEALAAARASGVEVRLDGKDLIVSSAGEPPADICAMLSGHKADLVEFLQAVPAGPPPPPTAPAPVRPWSAADWLVFLNDRQMAAEIALGQTRGQARAYAFARCVDEWRRTRPGATEAQARTALAGLGITNPSPPPPLQPASATPAPSDDGLAIPGFLDRRPGRLPAAPPKDSSPGADPSHPIQRPWGPEDWKTYFNERSAIAEYDGKLPRAEAEAQAYACCRSHWLLLNPMSSDAKDGCVICGASDRVNDPLLPVGITNPKIHCWVHSNCRPAWHAARMAAAAEALREMGVKPSEASSL